MNAPENYNEPIQKRAVRGGNRSIVFVMDIAGPDGAGLGARPSYR